MARLESKDVKKAVKWWWVTSHMTYNYQRLQAGSLCGMMGPILDKLYDGDKEKVSAGLVRHMQYFNTEPRWGAILPGMVVALEEGIGDTVWAGLIKPVILSIILAWAAQGYVWGAWMYGIGVTLLDFVITYVMFNQGYKLGVDSVDKFLEGGFIGKVTTFLGMVGLFCLGAMIVKYVTIGAVLKISLTTGELDFGALVNRIFPCLLPLAFTYLSYKLQVKGKSITTVLLVLFVIGFVGGAIGLLG